MKMIEVYEANCSGSVETIFTAAEQLMRDLQRILREYGLSPADAPSVLSVTGAAGAIISADPNFAKLMGELQYAWVIDHSAPFGISLFKRKLDKEN